LTDGQAFTPSFVFPILGPFDAQKMPAYNFNKEEEKEKEQD
jgi:hypothetical protein